MTLLSSPHTEDEGRIVERRALPAPVPDEVASRQQEATVAWHVRLWRWLRGYTAEDINRLKEAGVSRVEAETDAKAAEAALKISEAHKNFAEKEKIAQEALLIKAQAARTIAEADKIKAEAEKLRVDTVVDAIDRLSTAASRIRQSGGEIFLDKEQLEKLIRDAAKLSPNNKLLEGAIEDIDRQ